MRSSRPARLPAAPPDGAAALPPPPPERGPRRSWCGAAGPGRVGGEGGREGGEGRGLDRPLLSCPSAGRGAWRRPRDGGVRRRRRRADSPPEELLETGAPNCCCHKAPPARHDVLPSVVAACPAHPQAP